MLKIIADEGGETTVGRIIRNMPCYTGHYTRSVIASLGRHDYLDWMKGGKVVLTKKGAQSLRLSEEDWAKITADKEQRERELTARSTAVTTPMVGSELRALNKVRELKRATTAALSQELNISTAQASILLQSLIKRGYISGNHKEGYELTPEGRGFLEG